MFVACLMWVLLTSFLVVLLTVIYRAKKNGWDSVNLGHSDDPPPAPEIFIIYLLAWLCVILVTWLTYLILTGNI